MGALGSETGAKAKDVEFFTADITIANYLQGEKIYVYVAATADSVEYTLDSGSTWHDIKGSALAADVPETFTIFMDGSDTLNFRCPDVGGCTLDIFKVVI